MSDGRKAAGMSRRQLFILLGVVALASFLAGPLLWNPLRRPSGFVRSWLLGKTPVGTSRSEVEAFVKSQGWSIGAYGQAVGEPGPPPSSIQAGLGSYDGVPWRVFVHATW